MCLVIVNGSGECTIWDKPRSQNNIFYSDVKKARLCKVMKTEEVKLLRECVLFGHGKVHHEGSERKMNHGLQYHLYVIPEDVDLRDAVALAYGDLMYRNVQNKCKVPQNDVDTL